MCIEDIRLGRNSYSGEQTVSVGTSLVRLCSHTPNRISLIISPPSTGSIYISTRPNASTSQGLLITSTDPSMRFTIRNDGDLVRREWFVIGSTTGISVTIFETILDQQ